MTRTAGVGLFAVLCTGLLSLIWVRLRIRWTISVLFLLGGIFLASPGRVPDKPQLRAAYLHGMTRYAGVAYFWGGESPKGIDCSGLIRRGLIDTLFAEGLRTGNPALVRKSISLWWHDCTAKALGEGYRGLTSHVLDTPSLNALDDSKILPGDLAVTDNGVHIMAFLGAHRWIEADPGAERVIIVDVPSRDNGWFQVPMRIMRWEILADQPTALATR